MWRVGRPCLSASASVSASGAFKRGVQAGRNLHNGHHRQRTVEVSRSCRSSSSSSFSGDGGSEDRARNGGSSIGSSRCSSSESSGSSSSPANANCRSSRNKSSSPATCRTGSTEERKQEGAESSGVGLRLMGERRSGLKREKVSLTSSFMPTPMALEVSTIHYAALVAAARGGKGLVGAGAGAAAAATPIGSAAALFSRIEQGEQQHGNPSGEEKMKSSHSSSRNATSDNSDKNNSSSKSKSKSGRVNEPGPLLSGGVPPGSASAHAAGYFLLEPTIAAAVVEQFFYNHQRDLPVVEPREKSASDAEARPATTGAAAAAAPEEVVQRQERAAIEAEEAQIAAEEAAEMAHMQQEVMAHEVLEVLLPSELIDGIVHQQQKQEVEEEEEQGQGGLHDEAGMPIPAGMEMPSATTGASLNEEGGEEAGVATPIEAMNRNARRPKKANHGKRPCSRVGRVERFKHRLAGKGRRYRGKGDSPR